MGELYILKAERKCIGWQLFWEGPGFEDCEDWDGMIVKDPMNVILVKENAFYLAKRISDPKGKDMIYEQSI